ncbi:interleukin-2 receptor subunit alpha [Dromiciops gliroides]|uniref:interleukin-2 receptor subunit alpha n=1 Tax=Dromiciops gliroides TaxID=33562 RepID=UPI001CC35BDE|nr:interleukin-2 receptor subunit alpha [Dromiciops gliroides]
MGPLLRALFGLPPNRWTNSGAREMAWNFLLIWGIFTSPMVADYVREEECPHPPQIDSASYETQIYMTGTKLDCSCKPGYDRKEGTPFFVVCAANYGHPSWSGKCQCKSKSPQSHEEEHVASVPSNPGKQTNRMQTSTENILHTYSLTSHCQEPVLWSHASGTKNYQFMVGQKLQYQCLETAIYSGTAESTCMKINGQITWTKPHLKCTVTTTETSVPTSFTTEHKTAASTETSVPTSFTTEHNTEASTETSVPSSFTTEYKIAAAVCIFLISFIIFLVWITWRKRWRRRWQNWP